MADTRLLNIATALRHLRQTDPRMVALIERHGSPSLRRTRNSFRSLVKAIIFQQLSGRAAANIYQRFVNLFPGWSFPKPADVLAVPVSRLRGAGLSSNKAAYIHNLAMKYVDGFVQPRRFGQKSDEEIIQLLTQIKGIGTWTVHMFLIFGLNRPDVLPVGDLGLQKGFQRFFRLRAVPSPEIMQRLAEPSKPYRTIASWYLWRVADTRMPD